MKKELKWKIIEMIVSNSAAIAVFYVIYLLMAKYSVMVQKLWFIPAILVFMYLLKEDIDIFKSKTVDAIVQ